MTESLEHASVDAATADMAKASSKSEEEAKHLLRRVAERHSRADLDIDPSLYPAFVDSLIETSKEFDPQFTADVERAWREALAPGIAYMINKY